LLELTRHTIETVRELSESSGMAGLRIFADPRSGTGDVFVAALVDAPAEGDRIVEDDGAVIYLDAVAAEALGEKRVDIRLRNQRMNITLLDD